MYKMNKMVAKIAKVLLVVGGLNWGLVGALDFNLVTTLFGTGVLTTVVYVLVGVSALFVGAEMVMDK